LEAVMLDTISHHVQLTCSALVEYFTSKNDV